MQLKSHDIYNNNNINIRKKKKKHEKLEISFSYMVQYLSTFVSCRCCDS